MRRFLLLCSLIPLVVVVARGFAVSSLLSCTSTTTVVSSRVVPIRDDDEKFRRIPNALSLFPRFYKNKNRHFAFNVLLQQQRGGGRNGNTRNKSNRLVQALTATTNTNDSSSSSSGSSSSSFVARWFENKKKLRQLVLGIVVTTLVSAVLYEYRTPLSSFFNKDEIQRRVLSLLHSIPHNSWYGIALYAGGMAMWELLGMATIPVETAAGMVFGFKVAFVASAIGKLLGALVAFVLGRTILKGTVGPKLVQNKVLGLVRDHVNQNPFKVALLLRYSLLPEAMKNCGASLFEPIRPWMFVLSIVLHGWMFTACWTYVGVDAAQRLESTSTTTASSITTSATTTTTNRMAQFALLWATVVGCVLTPIIMAWWIRDMQQSELNIIVDDDDDENDDESKNKKNKI